MFYTNYMYVPNKNLQNFHYKYHKHGYYIRGSQNNKDIIPPSTRNTNYLTNRELTDSTASGNRKFERQTNQILNSTQKRTVSQNSHCGRIVHTKRTVSETNSFSGCTTLTTWLNISE